jgi:hypothetical protein
MRKFNVYVSHDAEAKLWVVDNSDIPGLNVEASSFDQLVEIVLDAAPDLVAVNIDESCDDLGEFPVDIQYTAMANRVLSHA